MVHYGLPPVPPQPSLPLPTCPKCGSHRTQVIGRLDDGRTMILRCNACGAHSTLVHDRVIHEFMERLPYDDAGRDLNWLARD
jgi:hypothetical protein